MIPEQYIEQWRQKVGWQTPTQVEQDLVISRTLVCLYTDPHIKEALVFRGGTALNKLFITPAVRYSEDIDFVQKRAEPIGKTLDRIRGSLHHWLGNPTWTISPRSVRLIYKFKGCEGQVTKLKIEINTTEHFQVLPLKHKAFSVESDWFSGSCEIATYEPNELMATKLRALYQRRKGRDLFDLWYVYKHGLVDGAQVIAILERWYSDFKKTVSR